MSNELFSRIQQDYNKARVESRAVDANEATRMYAAIKVGLLSTLLGDVNPGGGVVPTDDRVIEKIVQFMNKNEESTEILKSKLAEPLPRISPFPTEEMVKALTECRNYASLVIEWHVLNSYIPPVFGETNIRELLVDVNTADINIGKVMGLCKAKAAELGLRFDGKVVKRVLDNCKNEAITMTAESYDMITKLAENPPELNDTMKAAIKRSENGVIEIEAKDHQ